MKILIDASSARSGGSRAHFKNVIPILAEKSNDNEFHVLLSKDYQQELIDSLPSNVQLIEFGLTSQSFIRRWIFLQTTLPMILRKGSYDILFTLSEISSLFAPCPSITLVRNANFFFSNKSTATLFNRMKRSVRRLITQPLAVLTLIASSRLVFVSESFRKQVTNKFRLNYSKTRVIRHGISPEFTPERQVKICNNYTTTMSYILTVTSISEYKNLDALIKAYSLLIKNHEIDENLVIVGGIANESVHRDLKALADELDIFSKVHFVGEITHRKLPDYYRNASLFVLTSSMESFGIPLVEAMASGTPVVASDLEVCRELCGDAAIYFDPAQIEKLSESMKLTLGNKALRSEMKTVGLTKSKQLTWDNNADQIINIFKEFSNEQIVAK